MASESELEVVSRLVRALTHRVRGDLSVITNDLVYIASLVDPAEVARPRDRCAQISRLLGVLGVLTQGSSKKVITLGDLAKVFGVEAIAVQGSIEVDTERMSHAVELLSQLLGGIRSATAEAAGLEVGFVISLQGALERKVHGAYPSVSSFAASELGESAIVTACVIDLIVRDHGWMLRIEQDEETPRVKLSIPRNR